MVWTLENAAMVGLRLPYVAMNAFCFSLDLSSRVSLGGTSLSSCICSASFCSNGILSQPVMASVAMTRMELIRVFMV